MQKVLANTEKPTMNHKEYKVLMDTPAFTVTHDGTLRSKVTISAGRIAKVDLILGEIKKPPRRIAET